MGVLLRLIDLPSTEGLSTSTVLALRKHLLSASIRMQVAVAWVSEHLQPFFHQYKYTIFILVSEKSKLYYIF